MARARSTYSRIISWLKILLPLLALGLLSTIFLLSTDPDPASRVPFSVAGIDGDVAREQVTKPYFAGTTNTGASLTMTAATARPVKGATGQVEAEALDASIVMADGSQIDLTAPGASVSDRDDRAELTGGVTIYSSAGYTLTTEKLSTALSRVEAESAGAVQGAGPLGTLEAGKLRIVTVEDSDDVQLLFTGGVKLVYDPQKK